MLTWYPLDCHCAIVASAFPAADAGAALASAPHTAKPIAASVNAIRIALASNLLHLVRRGLAVITSLYQMHRRRGRSCSQETQSVLWYATAVSPRWFNVLASLCVASCAATPQGAATSRQTTPSSARGAHVTPANIRRLRSAFPPGYEITDVVGAQSPVGYWGVGAQWTADPPQCAALGNPVRGDAPPQGLAGSGPGGIVYAVVATSETSPLLDPGVVADCSRFTITAGRTSATVDLVTAPKVDGAPTLGMSTAARTVVEGGTETDSAIETVTAYLGHDLVFVVVVTDPGATHPPLPPEFAGTMLVKAVATLRG
jgi:hypothetical protein